MRLSGARAMAALVAALASACSFDAGGGSASDAIDAAPGDAGESDADPGAADAGGMPVACDEETACPLTCAQDEGLGGTFCTAPSNIPPEVALACGAGAPELVPVAGTVSIENDGDGGVEITCTVACDGVALGAIAPVAMVEQEDGAPPLAVFCLAQVNLGQTVDLVVAPGLVASVALLVQKGVAIAGDVSVDGGDGLENAGGVAGAGGGAGAGRSGLAGNPGGGMCGGSGGDRVGVVGDHAAGGGGGGGHAGAGGGGGQGVDAATTTTAVGGNPGGPDCGREDLRPLRGGGGGGGGGDGSCGVDCGWAGGGGGGALQISARGGIAISGVIHASGGVGYGSVTGMQGNGGAGGGGAGGAILLEGPEIVLSEGAALTVNGGAGGVSGGGPGGTGASGSAGAGGPGDDGDTASEGGSGGGGGGGRIRLNATVGVPCGIESSPEGSCSAGPLRWHMLF